MTDTVVTLPAGASGGYETTRFNALRHGVLSRCTVLPWEDEDEYPTPVEALEAEHKPTGPTEEHLVEELAGILWRKRRLRLAEESAHRRRLGRTMDLYRDTVKMALVAASFTGRVTLWQEQGVGGKGVHPFRSGTTGRWGSVLLLNAPKKSFDRV
jgi:hypothetical protein